LHPRLDRKVAVGASLRPRRCLGGRDAYKGCWGRPDGPRQQARRPTGAVRRRQRRTSGDRRTWRAGRLVSRDELLPTAVQHSCQVSPLRPSSAEDLGKCLACSGDGTARFFCRLLSQRGGLPQGRKAQINDIIHPKQSKTENRNAPPAAAPAAAASSIASRCCRSASWGSTAASSSTSVEVNGHGLLGLVHLGLVRPRRTWLVWFGLVWLGFGWDWEWLGFGVCLTRGSLALVRASAGRLQRVRPKRRAAPAAPTPLPSKRKPRWCRCWLRARPPPPAQPAPSTTTVPPTTRGCKCRPGCDPWAIS
jgi:hypothetical protein